MRGRSRQANQGAIHAQFNTKSHVQRAHTLAQFGVPLRLQASLAWFMPACELVIASMLTLVAAACWGALVSAILLGIYTGSLGYQLQRGRRPSCNCLGQQEATPIGLATLRRNGVLLLMAAGLIYAGPAYPYAALWPYLVHAPALAVGFAVVALQWWLLHHVLQQNGRLILQMDSMEMAPSIDNWQRRFLGWISIALILRAEAGHLSRPRAVTTLLAEDRHVAASYDALVTPSAVMVRAEGTIASHLALGSKGIYDLLQSSAPHLHEDSEIAA